MLYAITFIAGAVCGFFVAALCVASKNNDLPLKNWPLKQDDNTNNK